MASRRVYFAVFGSGLGHVTRVVDIANTLGDDYAVQFSTSGQALEYLKSSGEGENAVESPFLDVEWGSSGGFSSWHVLPRFPYTLSAFFRQLAFEQKSIPEFRPSVILSDSRLSAVLAARMKAYPVVTMLNQFVVAFPPRFRSRVGRFYERVAGDVLSLMWSLSDQVLMTDLPPPYTIGETNLSGSDLSGVVKFVGFTSPTAEVSSLSLERARSALDLDNRPVVFCQISGPEATKERFAETVLRAAPEIAREYNLVVSIGRSGGSPVPRKLANGAWVFDWCPIKDELFALSDVLIARAGHRTIGQCIDLGKPAILVPIHNHSEQIGNADKFARLGLGLYIRSEKLTPDLLVEAVEACVSDPGYRKRMEAVRAISKKYNGIGNITEILRSFA